MRISVIIIIICCCGCFAEKHNLVPEKDYDSIVLAENVSLFGSVKYEPAKNRKDNIQLLYKNGQLKYISSGNRKLNKYAVVKNVTNLNDGNTMLTWKTGGTHQVIDTVLITSNGYYIKSIHHCGEPAQVKFSNYVFGRKYLTRNILYVYPGDPIFNESIRTYMQHQQIKNDTLYKYENMEDEKMRFLRHYVYYLK